MNGKGDPEMGDAAGNHVPASYASNEKGLRRMKTASILFRLIGAPLCIVALVLMVTDKQVHDFVVPITPPLIIPKVAKYTGVKALVFYVYVNGIVAGYMLLHALFSMCTFFHNGSGCLHRLRLWLTFILDQVMVYVLLAAASATTEVAYIAENGDTTTGWEQTCDTFGRFCSRVGASIFTCFIGILALVLVAVVSARQLFGSSCRSSKTGTSIAAPKNFGRN